MECRIEGDTLPFLIVRLEQGDEIVAEVGSMAYMTEGVKWSITLWGRGLIAKLWGMVRRRLTGETVLLTRFQGNGEVAFTGKFPGTIQRIDLDTARTVIAQRGSFLAATRDVRMKMAVARRLRATLFGGEKLLLQKFQGPGTAWLHAAGDFKRFDLKAVDILPSLKEGDSYGAGHKSELRTQSLRWVPAAGGIVAPLTSQAIRACPALRMLMAPTQSACA